MGLCLGQNTFAQSLDGYKAHSCKKFIADDSHKSLSLYYAEAANDMILDASVKQAAIDGTSVGRNSTAEFRHQWLKQYCSENPHDTYADAVAALYDFMSKNKM